MKNKFEVVNDSMNSIINFFKNSYLGQKEMLSDGVSFLKDGLSDAYDKTRSYVNTIAYPINNFLKDFTQIDEEFKIEADKDKEFCICLDGKIVSETEALSGTLEENY